VPHAYAELERVFERVAVSDIAWRRSLPWRASLARAWPELPDRLEGPSAETALVGGWLRSRVGIEIAVGHAEELPSAEGLAASELLSEQLDVFGRDAVYEAAVSSAGRS
jgi:hypothetical protein